MIRFTIMQTTKAGVVCACCGFPARTLMSVGPFGRLAHQLVNMMLCKKCFGQLRAAVNAEPETHYEACQRLMAERAAQVPAEVTS